MAAKEGQRINNPSFFIFKGHRACTFSSLSKNQTKLFDFCTKQKRTNFADTDGYTKTFWRYTRIHNFFLVIHKDTQKIGGGYTGYTKKFFGGTH